MYICTHFYSFLILLVNLAFGGVGIGIRLNQEWILRRIYFRGHNIDKTDYGFIIPLNTLRRCILNINNNLLLGIVAIVAGILVLVWNDALQWIVGIFLIVWGVLTLLGKK